MDLSRELADWTDWDVAAFLVGRALGIFPEDNGYPAAKPVLWSDTPVGNALHEVLLQLVAAGVLERRDEPDDQFRWAAR